MSMTTTTSTASRPAPAGPPRGLGQLDDLTIDELHDLLDLAAAMRADRRAWRDSCPGGLAACVFEVPSTRARVAFEAAAHRLGMLAVMLDPDELQLGRVEPVEDTARSLSGYADVIVARVYRHALIERLAASATVPVVNARSDEHDPCQSLADLLTLRDRFGFLGGLRLAYVGDLDNVAGSLIDAAALTGMSLTVAAPEDARQRFRSSRGECWTPPRGVHFVADPVEAVSGAHAVYTDAWVPMGDATERYERRHALEAYRVTPTLMALAAPDAAFLHCLPAQRGEEVDTAVVDGPQSLVFTQAANRLPTTQALLYTLAGPGLPSE
jgi:ornithine carbamoyltransferase